jgi:hypothetical protein
MGHGRHLQPAKSRIALLGRGETSFGHVQDVDLVDVSVDPEPFHDSTDIDGRWTSINCAVRLID